MYISTRLYIGELSMKNKQELTSEAVDILTQQAPHELEIFNRWSECIDFYIAGYYAAINDKNRKSSNK